MTGDMSARDYAATHRILCAHADLDGIGAHWLEPGEKCPLAGPQRAGWEREARSCTCPPGSCTRGEFVDHQGEGVSAGCMACADMDPGRTCLAAVRELLTAAGRETGQ